MTVIAVAPFVLKNALLSVAVDNYEKHIGSALFNPQVNDLTWKGIDGSVARDQGTPEWSLTIDYAPTGPPQTVSQNTCWRMSAGEKRLCSHRWAPAPESQSSRSTQSSNPAPSAEKSTTNSKPHQSPSCAAADPSGTW